MVLISVLLGELVDSGDATDATRGGEAGDIDAAHDDAVDVFVRPTMR